MREVGSLESLGQRRYDFLLIRYLAHIPWPAAWEIGVSIACEIGASIVPTYYFSTHGCVWAMIRGVREVEFKLWKWTRIDTE